MKHVLLLASLFFGSLSTGFSQSENEKSFVREVGLNATAFVNNFLNLSNSSIAVSPYHLTYKKVDENGRAFRSGLGLGLGYSNGNPTSTQTFSDERKTTSLDIRLRMGVEKQRKISRRWYFNMGFDGLLTFDYFRIKTTTQNGDTFRLNDRRIDLGCGPVLGVQLMLTERMGLFTESTAYLIGQTSKRKDQDLGGMDEVTKSESINLGFVLPTNVYFFVRF